MGVVATLFGLAGLGLGGYRAARSAFRLPPGLPAALGAFVLAWAWATLGTLGFGLGGWLGRWPLVGWSVAGLLISTLLGRTTPPLPPKVDPTPDERWGLAETIAVGLSLWSILVMFVPTLLMPVKVISDGPIYHLYFAAKWWQSGRIAVIATPFGETAAPYFPANGDLWLTWLFATWGGERLAKIGQLPFFVASVASAYALARRAGAGSRAATMAACWFATITPLVLFSAEPIVDTIFATGYLLAVYFASRYALGDDGPRSLVLAGLAAGAAWGTKAPGVVFVPPLIGLVVVLILARGGPIRSRLRDAALLVASSFVLEGYWLARNAWLTGNPLYPLHLTALGRTILAGWYGPGAMRYSRYYARPTSWGILVDIVCSVFDGRLMLVWLAALAGAWRIGRPAGRGDRLVWACAGLAALNIALYWIVIPYRTQQRFFFHATALASVPLARLFDRGRWARILGAGLLALHVLTSQGWPITLVGLRPPWDLSPSVPSDPPSTVALARFLEGLRGSSESMGPRVATLLLLVGVGCLASAWLVGRAIGGSLRRWVVACAVVALTVAGQAGIYLSKPSEPIEYRFPLFFDYLQGWAALDLRLGRTPGRIAYAGTNLPYYLMGPEFRNEVRYINIDDHPDWLLHDYHRDAPNRDLPTTWATPRPEWDRLRADYDAWLRNLDREGIQLLVVTKADPTEGRHNPFDKEGFPLERTWADAHPDRFTRLYADELFRLYGVRPARKNSGMPTDRPSRSH